MGAFGCLFGGILLVFFLVLSLGLLLLQKILSIFGIRLPLEKFIRMNSSFSFDGSQNSNQATRSSQSSTTASVSQKPQKYGDDEGEYVEFEEIKE